MLPVYETKAIPVIGSVFSIRARGEISRRIDMASSWSKGCPS